jgi:hypothetical protein
MMYLLRVLKIFKHLEIFFMMTTKRLVVCLRGCLTLEEEQLAFQRRALSPRKHRVAWMLAWRHVVNFRDTWVVTIFMQVEWTQWSR